MEEIKEIKPEYKNIRVKLDGSKGYYLGWQMNQELKEVSKEEYLKSKLPILIFSNN